MDIEDYQHHIRMQELKADQRKIEFGERLAELKQDFPHEFSNEKKKIRQEYLSEVVSILEEEKDRKENEEDSYNDIINKLKKEQTRIADFELFITEQILLRRFPNNFEQELMEDPIARSIFDYLLHGADEYMIIWELLQIIKKHQEWRDEHLKSCVNNLITLKSRQL